MPSHFLHTNLNARDWRRLATFYQDVFGFVHVFERHLAGQWLEDVTGVPRARIDGVHLRVPGHGDSGPTLEVFQYGEIEGASPPPANRVGFGHIALGVDDVAAAREAVLAAGGSPVGTIVKVNLPDGGAITMAYVRDPEGNIIELQRRD